MLIPAWIGFFEEDKSMVVATSCAWVRYIVLASLITLSLPAKPSTASVISSIEKAAHAYDQAQVTGDKAQLERLLADDYVLVNGAGELETKAQLIADFTSPTFRLRPYVVEHALKRVWSNAAVLAGEVRFEGTDGGSAFRAQTRFVDVWRRRGGRWQVVYTQVTRLKP